ncbi:WD40-repeat-containing domain protein [Cantharellus anzutake]|uniref:WD40-repeat-containing domain protein n=1 Tax=Cantharellus anzutake TaxID=1750568 RepID=UPI0019032186|nr:WD40-repeat-containing domain protein [Cantharellus anzutake]KAF8332735.1 WD40-repeat-containing domain protein [Cantharellus anzutake]
MNKLPSMTDTTGPIQVGAPRARHDIFNLTYSSQRQRAFEGYERRMKQLQEVLKKWVVIIREINTDIVLADAIDKIQDSLRGVSDAMRRIVRPLWGGATPSEMKIGQKDQYLSDALPEILEGLAQAVDEFISGLSTLPFWGHIRRRVVEEAHRSLLDFNRDLLYWSINLRQFSGDFYKNAIRHHVSTVADHMSDHFDNVTKALEDYGLYMIKFYERRPAFQNLSTVATLFAGVSASSIQFSYDGHRESTFQAVEFLWILSLCFSIASAIGSQASYQLSSAVYIKSDAIPPMWVSAWIVTAPFIFLLISVGSFALGIALFTFLKFDNARYAPVLVTIALATWVMGSICAYMWFFIDLNLGSIAEKWAGVRRRTPTPLRRTQHALFIGLQVDDIEKNHLAHPNSWDWVVPPVANQPPPRQPIRRETFEPTLWDRLVPLLWKLGSAHPEHKPNDRLRRLIMRVVEHNRTSGPGHDRARIRRENNWRRIDSNRMAFSSGGYFDEWTGIHVSAVHDIQFSADGKYMATCSQDQTIVIWTVDPSDGVNVLYSSPLPLLISQLLRLSWHPKYPLLAVMPARSDTLIICDISDTKPTISPLRTSFSAPVRAIAWMPNNKHLVYGEDHHIRCINAKWDNPSNVQNVEQDVEWDIELSYSLDKVAITPDGTRAIVICMVDKVDKVDIRGTVEIKPSRSPPERRIILINIEGRQIIFEMPTLNQVRGLDISSYGALVLVTYEGKASPQLFRIHSAKLVLLQTYCLPEEVEYSGSGQLGFPDWTFGVDGLRKDDCVVISANKKGTIFIWDRESSDLLNTLETPLGRASSLTGFAWNHGSIKNPMIAASSTDGTVWLYNRQSSDPGAADWQSTIASTHP